MASDNPFDRDDDSNNSDIADDEIHTSSLMPIADNSPPITTTTTNNNDDDDDDDDIDIEYNDDTDDNSNNASSRAYVASLLQAVRRSRRLQSSNNDNNDDDDDGDANDDGDGDDDQATARALYRMLYHSTLRPQSPPKPELDFVSDDNDEDDSKSTDNHSKNILKRRFKNKLRRKRKLFGKLGKKHGNKGSNNNSNSNSSSNSSDVEAYNNYANMYELSELERKRAQLRLWIESRNDCIIRSILPNLDKNIQLQFKNYKDYKETMLQSIKEYEQTQLRKLEDGTMNTTNGNEDNNNDNESTPMSMDDNTHEDIVFPPSLDTNRRNGNGLIGIDEKENDLFVSNINNNSSRQESPHLPAEKDIIQSNSQSHLVLPYNFNHFLQYRETVHSNLRYNSNIRYKNNETCFPSKKLQEFDANSRVFCCDFSSDGSVLCCASQDHVISLIDSSEAHSDSWSVYKQVEASFEGWSIIDVALAPDHQFAAYSGWSENVCVVNTHGNHELHEPYDMDPHTGNRWGRCCAFGIQFDPDSQKIVAGWSGGTLSLYDLEMKQNEFRLPNAHSADINDVTFCDRNLIVTGSDDAFVKVFDRRISDRNKLIGGFIGHLQGITSVSVPDTHDRSNYVLSNGKDQCLKLWDLRSMNNVSQIGGISNKLKSHTNTFDYRYNGYQRRDRKQKKLRLDNSLMTYMGHSVVSTLIRSGFSPTYTTGNKYVYCGSAGQNCDVFIYDILTGNVVKRLRKHSSAVRDVCWHPYQPFIVSASWDGTVTRWGHRSGIHDGQLKLGKPDQLQEYLNHNRHLTGNSDISNMGNNKINNYLKGGGWSDDELLITSDTNNNNKNDNNDSDSSGNNNDSSDSGDITLHSRRRTRGQRGGHSHGHSHRSRKTRGNKQKSVFENQFRLTEKNSNVGYYKTKKTSMEMAGSRQRYG